MVGKENQRTFYNFKRTKLAVNSDLENKPIGKPEVKAQAENTKNSSYLLNELHILQKFFAEVKPERGKIQTFC